jgi:hypothetical protein
MRITIFNFHLKLNQVYKILNLKEDAEFDLRYFFIKCRFKKLYTIIAILSIKYQKLKFFFLSQEQTYCQEIEKQFTRLDASVNLEIVKKNLKFIGKLF